MPADFQAICVRHAAMGYGRLSAVHHQEAHDPDWRHVNAPAVQQPGMPAGQGHYYGLADALGGMILLICGFLDPLEVMHELFCILSGSLNMHGVCRTHQQLFEDGNPHLAQIHEHTFRV